MNKNLFPSMLAVLFLVLAACGTPSGQSTSPAAPTDTSAPAGPTTVPYDLTVAVTDQDGNPISWAAGIIQGAGSDESNPADDNGQIVWNNLSNPSGTITVSAQGFDPAQQTLNLAPGQNDLDIVLERNPYALNPSDACQPGEKILYVEDFEDGEAQDLDTIIAPAWNFVDNAERGMVLNVSSPGSTASTTNWTEFGNAVWMFDLSTNGMIDMDLYWHMVEVTEGSFAGLSRYSVVFIPGERFDLGFKRPGEEGKLAEAEAPVFEADSWHTFAIAYFQGELSIWVDGQLAMSANQEVPIDKGRLGIQINPTSQAEIAFDNFIVCELSGSYTPQAGTP